ncbi:metal-dependent transcriptional regulator [Bifidobacterium sp. ESL0820]|uniref:metal-dependent transcriptional regulator n=1 Tax=Bifidobacterium sp. ESL0820 TaxID=3448586 RepID=UPI0040427D9D
MGIAELSSSAQDYLKVIWDLQEWDKGPVQPTAVAERTGMKQSTVSGALGRLVDAGLVTHRPYGKVELTETGRRYAVTMVRRHRLLETFLVQVLGYGWDEVHEEADSLEHAVSDKMVDRIDEYLGHPTADPHGDAIPSADGDLPPMPTTIRPLSDVADGATVRVQRVSDEDPQILRTLSDHNIRPGCLVKIGTRQTNDGFVVSLAGLCFNSEVSLKDPLVLSAEHAALIQVSLL